VLVKSLDSVSLLTKREIYSKLSTKMIKISPYGRNDNMRFIVFFEVTLFNRIISLLTKILLN